MYYWRELKDDYDLTGGQLPEEDGRKINDLNTIEMKAAKLSKHEFLGPTL